MKTSDTAHTSSTAAGSNGAGQHAMQTTGAAGHHAADRGRELANQTFDQLAHAVESARNTAVPAIEKLTGGAESMAHRSVEMARAKSQQMRDQANLAADRTAGLVRQQPIKALLVAAAAGALLTMLFSIGKRDRH